MAKRIVMVLFAVVVTSGLLFATGGQEATGTGARELTVWEGLWYNAAVSVPTLADTPLYREVAERTGVNVTWIHPPQGQEAESFNLMIASNELPDLIYHGWHTYPGGPEKAITDQVIIRVNDVIADHAPNLSRLLAANPDWEKAAKTDNGTLYQFPFIRGHEDLMVFFGPQLRVDWLNELGLERPETLAEWEEVLFAFKNAGYVEHPLTFTNFTQGRGLNGPGNAFIQPFGTTWEFHQVNGEIKFGPYENSFRDFLVFFKDWFDKGLVDPEMFSNTRQTFDSKILNGVVAAWTSYTGSGIGAYLDANAGAGTFDIAATKYPVRRAGETPFMGQRDNPTPGAGMAITTQARDVQLAAEWADYAYGEEGHILFNFGIEGESYTWVTDFPGFEGQRFARYTPLMMRNPDGKTLAQMGGLYARSFYSGPIVQDRMYIWQYANRPSQQEAIQLWAQTEAQDHMLPNITATPDESQAYAEIMSEVNTYRDEMVVRFITGQEPISNFPAFQARLRQMGIERAIEIRQAGLDRYNAR